MLAACSKPVPPLGPRPSSSSTSLSCRGAGTTSAPTCPRGPSRCSTPAPGSPSGRRISRRSSRWSSSAKRSPRTPRSRSRRKSSTSTASGGRRRSTARTGSSGRSAPAPASSTSTRASARRGATSRTRRSRRPSTTRRKAARASRPSPSRDTQSGRAILEEHPDSPGSLGIAISEAVEDAAQRDHTAYSLGSVLNHVLLHPTVIGQEASAQMELAGAFPDTVIGCVGGGSNFAGLAFPLPREKIACREPDVLACEPAACPTLTRGLFAYDFGDTSKLTPLVPMHTLGHDFVPAPIHAGGLRYHGVAPLISQLVRDELVRAEAYLQNDVFASALVFAGSEGILPAPEAAHAIHGTLQAATAADEAGEERTILFNLSGHGHFDMAAYDNYFAGKLEDVALDETEMQRALGAIEGLPTPA